MAWREFKTVNWWHVGITLFICGIEGIKLLISGMQGILSFSYSLLILAMHILSSDILEAMLLLLHRLEQMDKEDDSGATATALFLRNDVLVVSHIGDSCLVIAFPPLSTCLSSYYHVYCYNNMVLNVDQQVVSRGGRPQSLTNFHRPYGNNKTSLEEVKRIRAVGGWVCFLFHGSAEFSYLDYCSYRYLVKGKYPSLC